VKKMRRYRLRGETGYAEVEGGLLRPLTGSIAAGFVPTGETLRPDQVELLPPIAPGKIVGIGLNYRDIPADVIPPEEPKLFLKSPQAVIRSGETIRYPGYIDRLTCEVELAVVIGKETKNVSVEEAMDSVFGYFAADDVTSNDLQDRDTVWGRAKNFDTFLPVSDYLVTGIDVAALPMRSYLNGELALESSTARMIRSVPELISFVSGVMMLCPGDVIITGTPTGWGIRVRDGDRVRLEIDGVGAVESGVQLI